MGDLLVWGALAALAFYSAVRGPKDAPFFRLFWLCMALWLVLLESLDVRGGSPPWLKWLLIVVLVALGICSYVRDECGQRTRYTLMWGRLRDGFAQRKLR